MDNMNQEKLNNESIFKNVDISMALAGGIMQATGSNMVGGEDMTSSKAECMAELQKLREANDKLYKGLGMK